MTVTTNERGQQNLFAKEPTMYVSQTDAERYGYEILCRKGREAQWSCRDGWILLCYFLILIDR